MSENKLNRLERSILNAEDSAEDARWMQAEEVVRRLDRGETERDVAASWINLRTGQPYSAKHAHVVAVLGRKARLLPEGSKLVWTDEYAAINKKGTDLGYREAQAPTTVESALKLAQNVMKSSPPKVQDALYYDLKQQRMGMDTTPAGRKASEARGEQVAAPARKAMAGLDSALAIQAVEGATESVKEVIEAGAVTSDWMRSMDNAVEQLQAALAEARFGLEVQR